MGDGERWTGDGGESPEDEDGDTTRDPYPLCCGVHKRGHWCVTPTGGCTDDGTDWACINLPRAPQDVIA